MSVDSTQKLKFRRSKAAFRHGASASAGRTANSNSPGLKWPEKSLSRLQQHIWQMPCWWPVQSKCFQTLPRAGLFCTRYSYPVRHSDRVRLLVFADRELSTGGCRFGPDRIGLLIGTVSVITSWRHEPHWYAITLLSVYAPSVWTGYRWERRLGNRGADQNCSTARDAAEG